MNAACFMCRSAELTPVIDVGPQPISNRFLQTSSEAEERYPIALRQCAVCGLVQIETPVPARALIPPYDWITYNEPEGHLDDLVDILMTLPGIKPGSVFGPTDVYGVRLPLPGDSLSLVLGEVTETLEPDSKAVNGSKNEPMMPVAWTKTYRGTSGKSSPT